ncbi:restriction endonuclease subunit S [Epibacterium ulvae]|uniref:restriction endonuclease subunit S n=1 Tax=Epibacterium ulvae TaxID=1156985 RepID=UPI0024935A04|nr:restriction endonuclease subunit S [Epibacterium ulvae]
MKTVGDAAEFLSGGTPKKSTEAFWNGDIPWFSASNMHDKFLATSDLNITDVGLKAGSRMAPSGTTLLLVRGSGLFNHIPICFADRDVAFNQDVKAIVAKDGVDPLYLHYTLEAHRRELASNLGVTGIGAGKFDTDFLKKLSFVHRDKGEQEEIGRLASAYDRKIELNRRMNETLEEMARALFRDWFVDFGPTLRQAEGATDPAAIMGHAFPPEKAATLAPLFPAKLRDDGLPEGWIKQPVGELAEIVGGGTPNTKTEAFWEGGTHLWATPRDLSKLSGVFISNTERKLTDAGLAKVSSGLSPKGSVLMSSRAPIGYLAIASEAVAVNQGFIVMRPTDQFPTHFAKLWCETNMETIEANANGSTFQEISKKNFKPILVTVPSSEGMAAFSRVVGMLFDKVQANEQENQTLAEMRDLLLPKLMSGEIRLKDAEKRL